MKGGLVLVLLIVSVSVVWGMSPAEHVECVTRCSVRSGNCMNPNLNLRSCQEDYKACRGSSTQWNDATKACMAAFRACYVTHGENLDDECEAQWNQCLDSCGVAN